MMTAADVVVLFASPLLLHNEDRRHLGWRVGCDRRLRIRRWRCPRQLDLPDWDQWFCIGLLQISGRRLLRTRFGDGGLRHFDAFIGGHALDRKHHQQRGHRGEGGHNPERSVGILKLPCGSHSRQIAQCTGSKFSRRLSGSNVNRASATRFPPYSCLAHIVPRHTAPRRTAPNVALLVFVMITVQPELGLTNCAIDYLNAETACQDHLAKLWAKALRQGR